MLTSISLFTLFTEFFVLQSFDEAGDENDLEEHQESENDVETEDHVPENEAVDDEQQTCQESLDGLDMQIVDDDDAGDLEANDEDGQQFESQDDKDLVVLSEVDVDKTPGADGDTSKGLPIF